MCFVQLAFPPLAISASLPQHDLVALHTSAMHSNEHAPESFPHQGPSGGARIFPSLLSSSWTLSLEREECDESCSAGLLQGSF